MSLKSLLSRGVAASLAFTLATAATIVCVAGAASTDSSMDCCAKMARHCAKVTDALECCTSSLPNFFAAVSSDSHPTVPAPTCVPVLDGPPESGIPVGVSRSFDGAPPTSSRIPTYLLVSVFRV